MSQEFSLRQEERQVWPPPGRERNGSRSLLCCYCDCLSLLKTMLHIGTVIVSPERGSHSISSVLKLAKGGSCLEPLQFQFLSASEFQGSEQIQSCCVLTSSDSSCFSKL